jgi:hypothetical protein
MRTDCIIDNIGVRCPNTSHLGEDRYMCKRGNWIEYHESYVDYEYDAPKASGGVRWARSLGRVCFTDQGKLNQWIIALAWYGDFVSERWIDPTNVVRVITSPTRLARFLFRKRFECSTDNLRKMADAGTLSERYIGNTKMRIAQLRAGAPSARCRKPKECAEKGACVEEYACND